MKITESQTNDILHWLDGKAADPALLFEKLHRDTAALIRQLQAEIEALRVDVEAWKASHSALTDTCHHFQARAARLVEALKGLTDATVRRVYLSERAFRAAVDDAKDALRDELREMVPNAEITGG